MMSSSQSCVFLALALTSCACSTNPPVANAAPVDARQPVPSAVASAPDAKPVVPDAATDAKPAAPPPLVGQDFIDEARILYRLAACGGDAPIPERFDAKL